MMISMLAPAEFRSLMVNTGGRLIWYVHDARSKPSSRSSLDPSSKRHSIVPGANQFASPWPFLLTLTTNNIVLSYLAVKLEVEACGNQTHGDAPVPELFIGTQCLISHKILEWHHLTNSVKLRNISFQHGIDAYEPRLLRRVRKASQKLVPNSFAV